MRASCPGRAQVCGGASGGPSCRGHAGCRPPLHWGAGTGSGVPPGSLHWGDIITRGQGMQGSAPCWAAARTLQEGLGQSKPWAPVTGRALTARRLLRGSMVRMPASSASAFLAAGASFARRTTLLCCRCPAAVVSWTRICAQSPTWTGKDWRCHPQSPPAAGPAPAEGWGTDMHSHLAGASLQGSMDTQWAHKASPGRNGRRALCSALACCRILLHPGVEEHSHDLPACRLITAAMPQHQQGLT